ncbi:hypothetical protein L596_027893 [Steinernema carpocapsae]|uniref:Aftiphilin clathrin-binding box domain-containing protein n=1 Tax=Steinernema carpocapsae TaxID=34508 RepID=A0A4U5LWU4_STECR|nr:hypothetical protein L596_027893 [Steinernema carpocapsae]
MFEEDDDEFGDFEEFGDFSSATAAAPSGNGEVKEATSSGNAWAGQFEETEEAEDDGWAADFSEAPQPSPPKGEAQSQVDPVPSVSEHLKEENFWSISPSAADCDLDSQDSGVFDILSEFDVEEITEEGEICTLLWKDIRIVEDALALKFQWKQSAANEVLLRILNMDVKKAEIKNSYFPAYAQHLAGNGGVLIPTQHSASSSTFPESNADGTRVTVDHGKPVTSLAVEPVNFNWSESGMVNPLTSSSVTAASEMLDFDFLVANERKGTSDGKFVSAALQRDLDEFGLNSPSSDELNKIPATTLQSSSWNVDELLKKQRRSSPCELTNGKLPQSRSRNELSLDAQALHDSLPDLDYMLSNVLMFPLPKTSGS